MQTVVTKCARLEEDLTEAKVNLDSALERGKPRFISAAKNKVTKATSKLSSEQTKLRHIQRDVDSTKTGQEELAKLISETTDEKELAELHRRRKTAAATRFQRQHASEIVHNKSHIPPIKILTA